MILVVDNYDSFTYNLVQYLGECGAELEVYRNDKISVDEIVAKGPSGIVLSPGPCTPNEAGVCISVSMEALNPEGRLKDIPIFGVCLGHQTIGEVGGGTVNRAKNIRHGKASPVEHDGQGIFAGVRNPFSAVRYHSLVIKNGAVPAGFVVTATALDDGEIMGVRHESLPIEGVQFHPESILTEDGMQMVKNFARRAGVI
ncbi:MAG TPA: aminodeoxychorismate/anthranilate synthase component II [Fimbriimonadaceae bacterium]|nr:aminodeoxychorismate/anthranilate synthase component II [Fimbriimonadaceae bacterium]